MYDITCLHWCHCSINLYLFYIEQLAVLLFPNDPFSHRYSLSAQDAEIHCVGSSNLTGSDVIICVLSPSLSPQHG